MNSMEETAYNWTENTLSFLVFNPFASLWPLLYPKPYELGLIRLKDGSRKNLRKKSDINPIIWVLVPVWPPSPTWRIQNLLNITFRETCKENEENNHQYGLTNKRFTCKDRKTIIFVTLWFLVITIYFTWGELNKN